MMAPRGPKMTFAASVTGVLEPASSAKPTAPMQDMLSRTFTMMTMPMPSIMARGRFLFGFSMSSLM